MDRGHAQLLGHDQVLESVVDHEGARASQTEAIEQAEEDLGVGLGDPFEARDNGTVEPTEKLEALEAQRVGLRLHIGEGIARQPARFEVTEDVQVVANGHLGETATADGTPFTLVTTPVQFAGVPAAPKRAPEFNEHCEEILADINCSEEEMIELKVAGVLA